MTKLIRPIFIWLPIAIFFSIQFILRVSPNVMADDILSHFHIQATSFGLLMSIYYVGYAFMQIPIGLLLDLYGPRYVASFGALACGIGGIILATTDQWYLALFSRLLMGVGSSGAFISASKAIHLWFPERYFSAFMGATVTIGILGAFCGGEPTANWVNLYGWQKTLVAAGLISCLCALLIFFLVKKKPENLLIDSQPQHLKEVFKNLLSIVIEKKILWFALSGAFLTGPLCAFADVWGVSYLQHVYLFSKTDSARLCTTIYVGLACAGPLLAFIKGSPSRRKLYIALAGLIMATLYALILKFPDHLNFTALQSFFFIIGILCSYQVLAFTVIIDMTSKEVSGFMIGAVNTIFMLGGLIFLPLIGFILELTWDKKLCHGVPVYSALSYQTALAPIVLGLLLGSIGFFLLRKKRKHS